MNPKAKINTDALRAFIGLVVKTWFPILVGLKVITGIDDLWVGIITAAIIGTMDAFWLIFKSGTPNEGGAR